MNLNTKRDLKAVKILGVFLTSLFMIALVYNEVDYATYEPAEPEFEFGQPLLEYEDLSE